MMSSQSSSRYTTRKGPTVCVLEQLWMHKTLVSDRIYRVGFRLKHGRIHCPMPTMIIRLGNDFDLIPSLSMVRRQSQPGLWNDMEI
jgi:hypothetical protein